MDINQYNSNDKINQAFSKEFNLPIQFISPDAITNTYYNYEKIESMAKWIMSRVRDLKPHVAIVCGSGLGEIAELVEDKQIVPYTDIPEFPRSTVMGHKGNLIFGTLSGLPVLCMQGRFHPFEGYSLALCTLPIKIFKLIGIKIVVLTNAAGSLNRSYNVGDIMLLKDHASWPLLSLSHPLIGPNDERFGPRFTAVNNVYDKALRQTFLECGRALGIKLHEGVYGTVGGPTYETVTDARMFLNAGMDVVGMSTSHEAVVAHHCGIKVLAFSIVTDRVAVDFDFDEEPNAEEILKIANSRARDAEKLLADFIKKLKEHTHLLD